MIRTRGSGIFLRIGGRGTAAEAEAAEKTCEAASAPASEDSADDVERKEDQEEVWAEAEGLGGSANDDG